MAIAQNFKELNNTLELGDYGKDLIDNYSLEEINSSYVLDVFDEFADQMTDSNYGDLGSYLADHVDEVNNVINEFGWDGVGKDLYKATQRAQFEEIADNLYRDKEEIFKGLAFEYLEGRLHELEYNLSNFPESLLSDIQLACTGDVDRFWTIKDAVDEAVERFLDWDYEEDEEPEEVTEDTDF